MLVSFPARWRILLWSSQLDAPSPPTMRCCLPHGRRPIYRPRPHNPLRPPETTSHRSRNHRLSLSAPGHHRTSLFPRRGARQIPSHAFPPLASPLHGFPPLTFPSLRNSSAISQLRDGRKGSLVAVRLPPIRKRVMIHTRRTRRTERLHFGRASRSTIGGTWGPRMDGQSTFRRLLPCPRACTWFPRGRTPHACRTG